MCLAVAFCLVYGQTVWPLVFSPSLEPATAVFLGIKASVEMAFSFPAASMIVLALSYPFLRRSGLRAPSASFPAPPNPPPPVGLVYLCCGDLDEEAVASLCALRHHGPLVLVIHDDLEGGDPRVDRLMSRLPGREGLEVLVLRRPEKIGGKPGALNYVIQQAARRFPFFLLCDNDSVALDPETIPKLLRYMEDPSVGAVQCRNTAVIDASCGRINRTLSGAIDVFDLFLSTSSRFGWTPFVGHNALLRTRAVREADGFTPGCFADDIDMTLRMNFAGYGVHYATEVPFGEKHPPSYAAFRKRTYKWAYGSMQVLRRFLGRVLGTPHLSLAEKWGFLQFIGFYTLQSILLLYVSVLYLLGPFVLTEESYDVSASLIAGSILPILIFLPVIVFSATKGRWRELPGLLFTCWLGYGSTDFPTGRGTCHGLSRRMRRWESTNTVVSRGVEFDHWCEAAFGALLLLVPLAFFPALLLSPLTLVVAGKFLFIPTMALLYRERGRPACRLAWRPILTSASLLLLALFVSSSPVSEERPSKGGAVEVRGRGLFVDGRPYVVRGVHYGPWRPGAGPGRSPFPDRNHVEEDLDLILKLHANTVLVYDPPGWLLDAAWERGLRVLYTFWLPWGEFGLESFANRWGRSLEVARELRDHPGLVGWVLGNEIPTWLIERQGARELEAQLRSMREDLRKLDDAHPVTHSNWPSARALDLSFFEICAFNLYALWPPEVVARGYESYVREVLIPIAGDRPLLVTEFGANSLEAGEDGQARLTRECWEGLRSAGAIGGFAFEFADEWWKNYSNPKLEGDWWNRAEDLDDHLRHDRDPEEHYGFVRADRSKKPAFAAVASMYADAGPGEGETSLARVLATGLLCAAAASLVFAVYWSRRRRGLGPVDEDAPPG